MAHHHDPLADSIAVVDIVSGLARREAVNDLDGLASALHVVIGHMSGGTYTGSILAGLVRSVLTLTWAPTPAAISTGAWSCSPAL